MELTAVPATQFSSVQLTDILTPVLKPIWYR